MWFAKITHLVWLLLTHAYLAGLVEWYSSIGLLPDEKNCGLHMRWECQKRFPYHWLQRKPLDNDPDMHHGMCVTQAPWCMWGSLTSGGRENIPSIPSACATCNFTYLARGPCTSIFPGQESCFQIGLMTWHDVLLWCFLYSHHVFTTGAHTRHFPG